MDDAMTETLAYDVVEIVDAIELRAYAPSVVAEVSVEASDHQSAANQGFRPLARYIFGNNLPRDKIAMTTPVMADVPVPLRRWEVLLPLSA